MLDNLLTRPRKLLRESNEKIMNEVPVTRPRIVNVNPETQTMRPAEPLVMRPRIVNTDVAQQPKLHNLLQGPQLEAPPLPPAPEINIDSSAPIVRPKQSAFPLSKLPGPSLTGPSINPSDNAQPAFEVVSRPAESMPIVYMTPDMKPVDEKGRPMRPFMKDPYEAEKVYRENLKGFQPKKESRWKTLGAGALIGLAQGMAQGDIGKGIGGAIGGAAAGALNPRLRGEFWKQREIADSDAEIQRYQGSQGYDADLRRKQADVESKNADTYFKVQRPGIEADKIDARKLDQRQRAIVSIFNRLPEFDPSGPENADLVREMNALNLPTPKKDRGSQFKLDQDPKTGEWRVLGIDKSTGAATASNVTQEGKPLITNSKQKFAQDWRSAETDEQRRVMIQEKAKDRTTRLQIAEQRSKSKDYSNEQFYQEINNQLQDARSDLSQIESEIASRKADGTEVEGWMFRERDRLKRETKSLGLRVAKENDKVVKSKASQSGGAAVGASGGTGGKYTIQQITERGRARGASEADIKQAIENARKAGKLQE